MKPLNKKKLAESKRKLRELITQRKKHDRVRFVGAYDDVYEKSMAILDNKSLAIGINEADFVQLINKYNKLEKDLQLIKKHLKIDIITIPEETKIVKTKS